MAVPAVRAALRAAALSLVVASGCHRGSTSAATGGAGDGDGGVAGATASGSALPDAGELPSGAPRCRPAGPGLSVVDAGPADLELGDAIALTGGGLAVAAAYEGMGGRTAAVVTLASEGAPEELVRLGATLGDAPPPRLAQCHGLVVAAAFETPRAAAARGAPADGKRSLALFSLASGAPKLLGAVPQQSDDSLGFDLACAGPDESSSLLAWDESVSAAGAAPHGVIRLAAWGPGRSPSPVADASPATSDAELPRVVRRGSAGFFVVWIAHRPEAPLRPEASADLESPAEARSFGWLEMTAVDLGGNVLSPAQPLTSTSGHVSAFDVLARPGEPKPGLLIVARDDGESADRADGAGGALLRVRVQDDKPEPAIALVTDGLGRGAPTFVDDAANPWLAWVGPREELRLLPLDRAGAPVGPPSTEDALDEARPLLSLSSDGRVLVATPTDPSAQLRPFRCRR